VSAVIPCLNEERSVGICVAKALQSFAALGVAGEVVVVDNGSSDRSAEVAAASGARVVREAVKGYGAALRTGIHSAQGGIIVMGDADDSYDWGSIGPFITKIQEGYDIVIGNRFLGGIQPGAMPPLHRYVGNPVLSAITRLAFDVRVGDVHCGMRAFTHEAFQRLNMNTHGMEFATEMISSAAHQRLRITEVPIRLYPDKRGRPPHLRTFRDGWRHLRFILTHAPDYLYLAPGALLLIAGFSSLLLLAQGPVSVGGMRLGIHVLALGALVTLAGFNVINLGVFAKSLMARRHPGIESRLLRLLQGRHTLEWGLIAGALVMLVGLVIDASILATWLAQPGRPMENTVHLAFVASTLIVLGLNLLFSSFLLAMVLPRAGER
jgi:hypothetical protein